MNWYDKAYALLLEVLSDLSSQYGQVHADRYSLYKEIFLVKRDLMYLDRLREYVTDVSV